jgi:hypothetical protein
MPAAPCGVVWGKEILPLLALVFLAHAARLVEMKRNRGRDYQAGKPLALASPSAVQCLPRLEPKVPHRSELFMRPPLRLSAVLLVPLVLPGVMRAQEVTRRDDQDAAIRVRRTEARSHTGSVVAPERAPGSESQGAAQQGLGGTEMHYQPGWYYPPSWPMNGHSFTGWDVYSDGGFQPFDEMDCPPASFWFYRPSTTFWFYRPSPSFWFNRPHSAVHPHH